MKKEIKPSSSQQKRARESLGNRMDEAENRIVTLHDNVEEMKSTSKHYENFKKIQVRNNQGMWDTMKRPKLHIIGIEEIEASQDNCVDHIFDKIIEENFPKLKKDITLQIQEAHRTPIGKIRKETPTPYHNQSCR